MGCMHGASSLWRATFQLPHGSGSIMVPKFPVELNIPEIHLYIYIYMLQHDFGSFRPT